MSKFLINYLIMHFSLSLRLVHLMHIPQLSLILQKGHSLSLHFLSGRPRLLFSFLLVSCPSNSSHSMSAERMKGRKLFTGGWKLIMEGGASTVLLTAVMAGAIWGVWMRRPNQKEGVYPHKVKVLVQGG